MSFVSSSYRQQLSIFGNQRGEVERQYFAAPQLQTDDAEKQKQPCSHIKVAFRNVCLEGSNRFSSILPVLSDRSLGSFLQTICLQFNVGF